MSSKLFCIFLLLPVIQVVFTNREENVNLLCTLIPQNGKSQCKFYWRIASNVSYHHLIMDSMQSAFDVWQPRANVSFLNSKRYEAITFFFGEPYNCTHTQVTPRANVCIHLIPNQHHKIGDVYFKGTDDYYLGKHDLDKKPNQKWIMEDAVFLIGRVLNYNETQIRNIFYKYSSEQ